MYCQALKCQRKVVQEAVMAKQADTGILIQKTNMFLYEKHVKNKYIF
jgi:hypothetical protein